MKKRIVLRGSHASYLQSRYGGGHLTTCIRDFLSSSLRSLDRNRTTTDFSHARIERAAPRPVVVDVPRDFRGSRWLAEEIKQDAALLGITLG